MDQGGGKEEETKGEGRGGREAGRVCRGFLLDHALSRLRKAWLLMTFATCASRLRAMRYARGAPLMCCVVCAACPHRSSDHERTHTFRCRLQPLAAAPTFRLSVLSDVPVVTFMAYFSVLAMLALAERHGFACLCALHIAPFV